MYGIRYQVGNKTYERFGFKTLDDARWFLMSKTSAFTWTFLKLDPSGTYRAV